MATPITETDDKFVFLYDRRSSDAPETKLSLNGVNNFIEFKAKVEEVLQLNATENYVISTTNRVEVKDDQSFNFLEKGDTLYLLTDVNQELSAPANERVDYLPHYDTIVKGGMYEYYASEGQNPLPYAFAELIDNSLAATALNIGPRRIELRLILDDSAISKNCVIFIDNGKGMTSRQLNNWAIYRLSKFTRRDQQGCTGDADNSFNLAENWSPRFMNSDISYFGVGGKQAIFFIGNSARMISKPKNSKDVHELVISKDEFEKREKNKQSIYTGFIRNRKPGDSSHISVEDENLQRLVSEEESRESFTAVVIQGINQQHLTFLKHNFKMWTRQLAHIYHFYLHGPEGNKLPDPGGQGDNSFNPFNNIDIKVSVHVRGNPNPKTINLRDIQDDMQTQYTRTSVSTFEFKAAVDGTASVEGIIRYHPFLYDRESYPVDIYGPSVDPEPVDDHGYAINDRPARGRRPIFETFWNGRLIPYTLINEFDWCSAPRKQKNIPDECFNRISGVLWTNDSFKVSTNKLTFLDLEMKLKEKTTNFVRMLNGHEKRTQIEREFHTWLKECSEIHDKQIMFSGCQGIVRRPDLPKHKGYPWTKFESVEWDGKVYKKGDLVRVLRTAPVLHGSIKAFYLYGELEDNVFGMGGDIEIAQEPQSIYTDVRFVALSKLDRGASIGQVRKYIEDEEAKLPDHLLLSWPNGNEVKQNDKHYAGVLIGDMKVEISNKKGEKISKIPGSAAGAKKLLVELKLIWHSPSGDETVVCLLSQHGKTWPYWFKRMNGTAKQLGSYTLQFQAVLNESGATVYAGRTLPFRTIKFSIIESDPVRFIVGVLDGPFKVGVPFQIPLEFQDEHMNPTKPPTKLKPILDADGLELCYQTTQSKGNSCHIRGVVAKGTISTSAGTNFNLKVSVPDMEESQILKIRLLPGPPNNIEVEPKTEIEVENGSCPAFSVRIQDSAGNLTSGVKMVAFCKMIGVTNLVYTCDCTSTGMGQPTGKPIQIKKMKGETTLKAVFSIQGMSHVKTVERVIRVTPSTAASKLRLFYLNDEGMDVEIFYNSNVVRPAGSVLDGLTFRVYNEAGNEIDVDDSLAAKIKVNWSPKVPTNLVLKRRLPPIKVPNLFSEVKYGLVSLAETGWIEVPFNLTASAGEATVMEYAVVGEMSAFRGQPLKASIMLTTKDKHGNPILIALPEWQKQLVLQSESLRTKDVKIQMKAGACSVSNLIFDLSGPKEVVIMFRNLECTVGGVQVVSGPPTQLEVMEWTGLTSTAHSDKPLLQPFKVKLLDADGNDSKTPDVKVHVSKDNKLKLTPTPGSVMTDSNGIADFGILTPSAPSGKYELQPKAVFWKAVINGPKLILHIQPDPHKVKSLSVEYNPKTIIIAGHVLPDFKVNVMAEDDTVMGLADGKYLHMSVWKGDFSHIKQQPADLEEEPPLASSIGPGAFLFKKCQAPKESGAYTVLFLYDDGFHKQTTKAVSFQVNPSSPCMLVSVGPQMTTVSNAKSVATRTLIKTLRLELRDEYNNSPREGYNGKVKAVITSMAKTDEIPVLTSGASSVEVTLVNGRCALENLVLQESSPGKDGMEYHLQCTVVCDLIPKNKPLEPLSLPFLFYNDAKKQQQMTTLCQERDALQNTIKAFQSMFDTQKQLIAEFREAVHDAQKREQSLRAELRKQNIRQDQLQTVDSVEKLIAARTRDREALLAKPRRSCALPKVDQDPQVLGKIAHLALVQQEDVATVLSWHMSADMDCVITLSTQKAKEIYSRTQGKQQVLPLDSIFRKNLPDWSKPLPHMRFNPAFKASGNPVYARNLLEFTKDEDSCRVVFGMLLGDTLILDNLDHANVYRQEIVKHTHCPTILTRSGDRIRSNGKFGGAMNRAPPVEKLKGSIFGQPLPLAYHAVCTQIESLNAYQLALSTHIQTQDELQEQISQQKHPDTLSKYKECQEAEARLKEVERKLGMAASNSTPSQRRANKHTAPGSNTNNINTLSSPPSSSGSNSKRSRLDRDRSDSPSTPRSSNLSTFTHPQSGSKRKSTGSSNSNISTLSSASSSLKASTTFDPNNTPSRTSLRIASMSTVVSDDGRKKLRKAN